MNMRLSMEIICIQVSHPLYYVRIFPEFKLYKPSLVSLNVFDLQICSEIDFFLFAI